MKIMASSRRTGREFLVDQVVENGGDDPWDGKPLQADYAATLVESLKAAEEAGTHLQEALERVADLGPHFVFQKESILGPLRRSMDRLEEVRVG
ncbi:MAG: hypothetical protein WEA10_03005 [Actinomycetota bacterium]